MNKEISPQQKWAKANPEKRRAIARRFYEKHGARIQAYRRAYRAKNRAHLIATKKAWDAANPEMVSMQRARKRVKAMNTKLNGALRYHYQITLERYNAVLAEQGGVCAICRKFEVTKRTNRLVVDHDHATGKIRGLLCHRCNCGLGYLKDDPVLIERAGEYLRRWADE